MKKKILWIVNIMLPEIAKALELDYSVREGWLSGIFDMISGEEDSEYEIGIAYPYMGTVKDPVITVKGIKCYPFYEELGFPQDYDQALEGRLKMIIDDFKPDMLHIFGTEFPHALAAAKVFAQPMKTLVGIQGLCSAIARDYYARLPERVISKVTFRDFIRHDSIKDQKKKFEKRGEHEIELLNKVNYITGRTKFDYEKTRVINPASVYLPLNESMRACFYEEDRWSPEYTKMHSIFLGQGDYPIKGMHFVLEAVGGLVKKYPDIKLYVAGNSIINARTFKDKLKTPSYGLYLRQIIKEYGLEDHIEVLGMLSPEKMKETYLKSSVFVCASYVENSPNTIAEAMLLGMPVVTSNAGGIPSMISEDEGIIVERGMISELREAIDNIFTMEDEMDRSLTDMCTRAHERAVKDHDRKKNYEDLLKIYDRILSE